ncbi:unnamed protein product [Oikopleura dioica]|uniref:Uncharacterized protein n=1 Tax=Oikopleura dioica TaxID=34765 RepID=E4XSU3_OIKDI|nr:unnamed protein product [Oikopleura dioica]
MTKHRVARLKLMREMFGDDFKLRLAQLGDDEEARRKLMEEQRRLFEEKLAAKLKMRKPKKLEEIEDADVADKELEKFSAEWLLKQMSDEEWSKLSEQERQRLIALAKLEAKKAQKELYGDEWLRNGFEKNKKP